MTNEEAINELLFAKRDTIANSVRDKALDKAIQALKKQISKDSNTKCHNSCLVCKCSRCGKLFTTYCPRTSRAKFCDDCNQQLDWSENDEN